MGLISEQLRILSKEAVLDEDPTPFTSSINPHDWTDRVTKNINLSEDSLIYVYFEAVAASGSYGAIRLVVNDGSDREVLSSGPVEDNETLVRRVIFGLAAGSYTFKFQSAMWKSNSSSMQVKNIKICKFDFKDRVYKIWSGSQSVNDNSGWVDIISQTINASELPERKTCIGTVKKYVAIIVACPFAQGYRRNKISDAVWPDYLNWKLLRATYSQTPKESIDDEGTYSDNLAYGEGAYALYVQVLDANQSYTYKLQVFNKSGSTRTCEGNLWIVLCPWILADSEYVPVDLSFAQQSTLYAYAEPLFTNPSKTIKLGADWIEDFGNDYSSLSGTGIQKFSYTFDVLKVSTALLSFEGYGGCVSHIAVDMR